MSSFLLSIASGLAIAVLLAAGRQLSRVSRSITQSAAAVTNLTALVQSLVQSDAANRERINALWERVYPRDYPPPQPSPPQWRPNEVSRVGQHARTRI